MDWIDFIIETGKLLIALYNALIEILQLHLVTPWRSSQEFKEGFITGLVFSVILGTIGGLIKFWRAQIDGYFSPTRMPATNPGPRPFDIYPGCLGAVVKLFVLGGVLLFAAAALVVAIGS